LAYARVRLDDRLLPTTPELIHGATRLQQAILELVEPWAEAAELGVQAQIRAAVERLTSALDELKAIVARPRTVQTQGAKQPSPDPETLLRDVFGLNQPLGWLTEQKSLNLVCRLLLEKKTRQRAHAGPACPLEPRSRRGRR